MPFILLLLLATTFAGCATAAQPSATVVQPATPLPAGTGISSRAELEALTIPPLPDWVDKYADSKKGDTRFFNISRLMERFQLQRHEAIELQNHYRDLLRASPGLDPVAAFNTALERVRRGQFESGLDVARLARADFIVVFDLDDTLIDQYYAPEVGPGCHDAAIAREDGSTRYVKFVPGWQQAIERIQALGGAVVLFSANLDENCYENLSHWKLGGIALLEHPAIAGLLTHSHLILQEKSEGEGATRPTRGHPVRESSKDLRMVDPSLRRVIIVDDNPTRLFQMRNARIFKKFHANDWCTSEDPLLRRAFEGALPAVVREVEESVAYMRAHGVDFAQAYLPFTSLGQVAVQFLMDSAGLERAQAIDYVRRHPKVVDDKY